MRAGAGLRGAAALVAVAVATALALEAGSRAAVALGWLHAGRPPGVDTGVWWGDHPRFGVWHRPGREEQVTGPCWRATYRINSVGARDVERPRAADGARVVVLGDSFLEGWGLPEEDRLSNRLEAATGVPHLNFAMAHFGPYQQLLVYEELAAGFDHTAVLASVLPTNDFVDLDLEQARDLTGYEYRYRPYLVGDPDDPTPHLHREPRLRRWLRHHSQAWHALARGWRELRAGPPAGDATPGTGGSLFYDFGADDLRRLRWVLDRLARSAGERLVAVLLIPVEADLRRYARDGADPLSARLAEAAPPNLRIVNLLPPMAERYRSWSAYRLDCDYHWSRFGNEVALALVREALDGELYSVGSGD